MNRVRILLGIALSAAALGGSVAAQDVTLRSTDGTTEFAGELIDFNGTVYTVKTRLGTLNIPAVEVTCIGEGCPAANQVTSEFRIAGDRSILRGALPELLDAYSLEVDTDIARERTATGALAFELLSLEGDPVVNVELNEAAADAAFQNLIAGDATLVVTSRRITDEEAAAVTGRDRRALDALGLERVIGLDGIVALVGKDVPIGSISIDELAAIYSGEITNWSELGGPDSAISAFTREPGSDIREAMERQVMGAGGKPVAASVISVDSNDGVANAVETFANGIGLTSYGAASVGRVVPIRDACGNEIAADEFTIKSEKYPLSVRVYVYEAAGGIPTHARGLVDFASSDLGQQVIEDTGYLDLRPITADEGDGLVGLTDANAENISAEEIESLERLRDATSGAERLSTTFRLANETGLLDGRGVVDLDQLARMVRSGRLDGQELLFVGIPGATGNSATNMSRQVIAQLFARDRAVEEQITVAFRILGYTGASAPTCALSGVTDTGHVEVWIKPLQQG